MDKVVKALEKEIKKTNGLNFVHADTHKLTNSYHPYPASMIPQLPDLFLSALKAKFNHFLVLDPFAGSGTTLVEAKDQNISGVGLDLNPLAVLIAKVKTTYLSQDRLEQMSKDLVSNIKKVIKSKSLNKIKLPSFNHLLFWFKPEVAKMLQVIRKSINKIDNQNYRDFFLIAFSHTVRQVSNSRNGEFKLYRMKKAKLQSWHPNVIKTFLKYLKNNVEKNQTLKNKPAQEKIFWGNSKKMLFKDNAFDAVITSPPYGDSATTVAYGQFSRLELQWIGNLSLNGFLTVSPKFVHSIDRHLLGGEVKNKQIEITPSKTLNHILFKIAVTKPKRARDVYQFYSDLYQSLKEIKRVVKPNGYLFFVTGNRTVDHVVLPTNVIIRELFNSLRVVPVGQFTRGIFSKRMPNRNSPSNLKHHTSKTMQHENIVIYKNLGRN